MNRRGFISALTAGLSTLAVSTRLASISVQPADRYTLEFFIRQFGKGGPKQISDVRFTPAALYSGQFVQPCISWPTDGKWHSVVVSTVGREMVQI